MRCRPMHHRTLRLTVDPKFPVAMANRLQGVCKGVRQTLQSAELQETTNTMQVRQQHVDDSSIIPELVVTLVIA